MSLWFTAHPRSRGENGQPVVDLIINVGSSPLTRGKQAYARDYRQSDGLIPAHAGKTSVLSVLEFIDGAHPRSRGENVFQVMRIWPRSGSSPLTRGKLQSGDVLVLPARLIPAHAGKTPPDVVAPIYIPAHPRSRGENRPCPRLRDARRGSSPLTRGKLGDGGVHWSLLRLIPAHAGKTRSRIYSGRSVWAHPRSRGENRRAQSLSIVSTGSSPLTRGKRICGCAAVPAAGLIPAHAGKTSALRRTRRSSTAHPRSRGENQFGNLYLDSITGSSPLTRGKRKTDASAFLAHGLIPAHAGKTDDVRRGRRDRRAHPRSRGENERVCHFRIGE